MADQLVLTDTTVALFGNQLVTSFGGVSLTVHLYDNDVTPTKDTILTDLNEASFPGYAAQPTAVPISGGMSGHIFAFAPFTVQFAHTPGADDGVVYGYFFKWVGTGLLGGVARFTGAPVAILALLTQLNVAIVLTDEGKYP